MRGQAAEGFVILMSARRTWEGGNKTVFRVGLSDQSHSDVVRLATGTQTQAGGSSDGATRERVDGRIGAAWKRYGPE